MRQLTPRAVVVGADGSPSSLNAVRMAAAQAAAYRCPLRVVHAFNWLPAMHPFTGSRDRDLAEAVMREAVRLARSVAPDVAISDHMIEGPATTALLREAHTAALLVIGDAALGARTCLASDTAAVQLAAHASSTVLVTRDRQPAPGPIVVGVDWSATLGSVLDFAFTAAARQHADLIVVRVHDPADRPTDRTHDGHLQDDVDRRAGEYAVRATLLTPSGDPADVLRAESTPATMLIVGPRGDHDGRELLGPVTQHLLHHAAVPLVVVRRQLPAPAAEAPAAGTPLTHVVATNGS